MFKNNFLLIPSLRGEKNGRLQVQKESKIKNTDTGRCIDSTKCGRSVWWVVFWCDEALEYAMGEGVRGVGLGSVFA